MFTISLLFSSKSYALENAQPEINTNSRTVQIYFSDGINFHSHGTGWLYSSNIVFTNAHILYNSEKKSDKVLYNSNNLYVGLPATPRSSNLSTSIQAYKTFVEKDFEWIGTTAGSALSYKNDFGIIILSKSISNIKTAKLVDENTLNNLINSGAKVTTSGYGFQNNLRIMPDGELPQKTTYNLINKESGMSVVNDYKNKYNRGFFEENKVAFVDVPVGGASQCDGDSGSGFYIDDLYLGATMTPIGSPNCGIGWWENAAIASFRPVYFDTELIKTAEAFQQTMYNKTIYCKKLLLIKKITSRNPVCPKGYILIKK